MKVFNVFFLLVVVAISNADIVYIDDGEIHTINNNFYTRDSIWLDHNISNDPGTHIDIVDQGSVFGFALFNNSTLTVNKGSVGSISALDSAEVVINGGFVSRELQANMNAVISLRGGRVLGSLITYRNGTIYLIGNNFEIIDLDGNKNSLSNGERLSDYSTLVEYRPAGSVWDYYSGTITGNLNDGSILNNSFHIYNIGEYAGMGDIVIIPEPMTVLLLGLGCIAFRLQKK